MSIPKWVIPFLAVVILIAGYHSRHLFTQPSTSVEFGGNGGKTVVCKVDGIKCQGTANFFTGLYDGVEGINSIETVASEKQATITFDPKIISAEKIQEVMEQSIPLRDGSQRQVFTCLEMKQK